MTDNVIPMRPADEWCNARLARRSGYCKNPSGQGTKHEGYGRCHVHEDGPDENRDDVLKSLGLRPVVVAAEALSRDDQEYLYRISNNVLVIQRAAIAQKMQTEALTTREIKECIEAIVKIDAILEEHTNELAEERQRIEDIDADAAEWARISKL